MFNDTLVTVVTCVYNSPILHLRQAVSSILSQTHKNFEYVIVDDCSDKDLYTDDIFSDNRISIIKLQHNMGPAAARNIAFDRAKGKYIAIMDSDDISLPKRFEKQVAFMEENPDVVACGTWFTQFGDKSNEVKRCIDDNEYYRCCLLFGNSPTILNPSVMLRASTMKEHQIRMDERLRKGEDYKLWVQLSQIGRCTNLHENLFQYRVHSSQTSQRLKTKDISAYDWIVIKEQYDALGMVFTPEEEAIMHKDFRSSEVDPYIYWKILMKILEANTKSCFFAQEKLEKRVYEQWEQKVFNTPAGRLLSLMKQLPDLEKKHILMIEKNRIFRKTGVKSGNHYA